MHADCSAELFKNGDVRQMLRERAPGNDGTIEQLKLPGFDEYVLRYASGLASLFLTFISLSLEQSVRDDVRVIKSSQLVRQELSEQTKGFIFDIKSGKLIAVV
jgi:carbonic anhydrase